MKPLAVAFVLMLVLALSPILIAAAASGAGPGRPEPPSQGTMEITGLDPLFPDVPPGGFEDHFPRGQCTWWAAYNVLVTWGGNAGDWLANASRRGRAVAGRPAVHSIAVYAPSSSYSPYGHVAVVLAVANHWFLVSEMNYADGGRGTGIVDQRWSPWPDPLVEGFVLPA